MTFVTIKIWFSILNINSQFVFFFQLKLTEKFVNLRVTKSYLKKNKKSTILKNEIVIYKKINLKTNLNQLRNN